MSLADRIKSLALRVAEEFVAVRSEVELKADLEHDHTTDDLTGLSGAVASLLDATDEEGARFAIGAGTSDLTLGSTATTAKAGDWRPSMSNVIGLTSALSSKADSSHEHEISDVSGLQDALDAKGTSSLIIGTTSDTAKAGDWTPGWSEITGKPTEFAPSAHTHSISHISGLQDELDSKGTSNLTIGTTGSTAKAGNWRPQWFEVDDKPSSFTPSAHNHSVAEVSGLALTLSKKADLDDDGKVPQSQIPAVALTDYLGEVPGQTEMLALNGQRGDWCTRTDTGTDWMLIDDDSSRLVSWREHTYPDSPVQSVAGRTGSVTLSTGDISGLSSALSEKADLQDGKVPSSQLPAFTPKPSGGWTRSDLDTDVRSSLAKADSALQSVTWSQVGGKPSTFTPSSHDHAISDVGGLQSALDSKGTSNLTLGTTSSTAKPGDWTPSWSEVSGKPSTFAPATHTHSISDVTGLQSALDSKGSVHSGSITLWSGTQAEYDALPTGTRNAAGFVAFIA